MAFEYGESRMTTGPVGKAKGVGPAVSGADRATGAGSGVGANVAGQVQSLDRAEVGGAEAVLATIESMAAGSPAVSASKIAEVKAAVAEGRYTMDPQRVAEKLAEVEHLLTRGQ